MGIEGPVEEDEAVMSHLASGGAEMNTVLGQAAAWGLG